MKKNALKCGTVLLATLAFAMIGYAEEEKPAAEIDVAVGMEEGVPGGVQVSTLAIQAKVVGIDYEARELELLLPGGVGEVIEVGPEVINFKQIVKGDMVKAMITEELVVGMGSSDAELDDGEDVDVALAPVGAKPGGIVVDTIRTTATVVEIDGECRTAILKFEDGSERVVAVRDDIDLTKRAIGEKVVFEMTKMVAISVEKTTAE
jgi:hypothetical protein